MTAAIVAVSPEELARQAAEVMWARDKASRALGMEIVSTEPGEAGMRLFAAAREVSRDGRSGIYAVRVASAGETIAEFRGHSRAIGGSLIEPAANAPQSAISS